MQRYFAEGINENYFFLSKDDEHHLINVLRTEKGQEIEIVFDSILYTVKIESLNPLKIVKVSQLSNEKKNRKITIGFAIPKGDKIELILQKCTELGIDEFVLFSSERTIGKISADKLDDKLNRYNKIVKEAAQQSKRISVPTVKYVGKLANLISLDIENKLVAYENAYERKINLIKSVYAYPSTLFITGPEGGFSEEEILFLEKNGFETISLGKNILRCETAPIYIASVVSFLLEGVSNI
ncbi:MAG: RsmE family RNA methyltransferase [Bacilli bacterium]